MNNREQILCSEFGKASIIESVDHLQREFIETSGKTPSEALFEAYKVLTDEQKIAFILAGGAHSLFHYQQHPQTGPDTGQLPVLY